MKKLDAVVIPLEGTNLIEASAGTGKTYTITTLALRLVVEKELTIDSILIVTFTRAATAELRERIRMRLGEGLEAVRAGTGGGDEVLARLVEQWREGGGLPKAERLLHAALGGFDEAAIFTIHGFCQRTLAQSAFESGVAFETELMQDSSEIVRELAYDYWAEMSHRADPRLVRHLRESGAGPEDLVEMVSLLTSQPDLAVLPTSAGADVSAADEAFVQARDALAARWEHGRAEVVDLLLSYPGWNRGSYRTDSIEGKWIPFLDSISTHDLTKLPDFWARLTPSGMKLRKGCDAPQHAFFDECERFAEVAEALDGALEEQTLGILLELKERARDQLLEKKRDRGVLAFDDLLLLLRDALQRDSSGRLAAAVRESYGAALIDEFQDTDPVQCDIFTRIYHGSGAPFFMIGDPKQAIYAFRGADIFAYLGAVHNAGERCYTLGTNYRSDPSMVEALNELFGGAHRPFLFDQIAFEAVQSHHSKRLAGEIGEGPSLEILFVPRSEGQPGKPDKPINKGWGNEVVPLRVAAEVARLLASDAMIDGKPIAPSDIAILSPTHGGGESVQEALLDLGIPAVREGDASVFDQPMAAELSRLLAAMAEPTSMSSIRAALVTRALGVTGDALEAMGPDGAPWDEWVERFHAWGETWERAGFIQACRQMMDDVGVAERLLSHRGGERDLTDLLHLTELAHAASMRSHLGPVALLSWLAAMREGGALRSEEVGEDAQIRLESDARAVQLTTIHRSKGLEYPIVFVPFAWDGRLLRETGRLYRRFHDPDSAFRPTVDIGSADASRSEERAREEARAEKLRLLYVALTRAKHRCTVVWGAFKEAEDSAFGFLTHQPQGDGLEGGVAERTSARILAASDEELIADHDALAEASGGKVAARTIPGADVVHDPREEGEVSLSARRFERRLRDAFRTSSFTQLAAGEGAALSPRAAEGVDHDAAVPGEVLALAPAASTARVGLAEFPAGATPGQLIHDVFENIDFRRTDPEELPRLARGSLERYGLDVELTETLVSGLADVLLTPLGGEAGELRLAELAPASRLNEMEFMFPISGSSDESRARALTPSRLGAVFARHGAPSCDPGYADRVARLGFRPLIGFLKGFVDLVFEHEGRFYVVDYKSNRLGSTVADYASESMVASMHHHDYFLQYHLYVVALHRHLEARLPEYDYDEHIGGVYYLFVRGMAPHHPPSRGVFRDRPERALIEELSELFTRPGGEG